jgi:predicted aspartyl protease
MGMFKKRVKVSNLANPELFFEQDFWVDTGALYSMIPEDWLEKIKAEPIETRQMRMANGKPEMMLFGSCNFEIEGLKGPIPCPVLWGPKDSFFLIGATTLEAFAVEVDPIGKELKPMLIIMA